MRDAYGSAKNVIKEKFRKNVDLIQYWDSDPINMMKGINQKKFDYALLHGYHAAGGSNLSPLSHTFSSRNFKKFTLNGKIVGETTFSIYTAAYFNVPVIYILGDSGAVTEATR